MGSSIDTAGREEWKTITNQNIRQLQGTHATSILCENYEITTVQPVDMFPHTMHVENCEFGEEVVLCDGLTVAVNSIATHLNDVFDSKTRSIVPETGDDARR